ncbi:MAG: hypothetical protein U1A72_10655 [Sulfuritalea sp.]|nr:hypothetical protein [Sulfuritalea sp.]
MTASSITAMANLSVQGTLRDKAAQQQEKLGTDHGFLKRDQIKLATLKDARA